ncbi:hypothetical protein BLOT_015450 [Blomia tropicalis]|nr:hypothetical protein BLOT_015450 [Blomia tropicalis]
MVTFQMSINRDNSRGVFRPNKTEKLISNNKCSCQQLGCILQLSHTRYAIKNMKGNISSYMVSSPINSFK